MSKTLTESDSMGTIEVPADKYSGDQTAHPLANFANGGKNRRTAENTA